jgi:hypothetical protein
MFVQSGDWTNFTFGGDLTGCTGVKGKLNFTIFGDIIADGQSLTMDKMSSDFAGMHFEFDFAKKRLTGTLQIDQYLNGTGHIQGAAESVIDEQGWYFCGGGKITMQNNPYINNASTAMLFGDYPVLHDPFISEIFSQYTYTKTLPTSFQGSIKGFYTECVAGFPPPYIPPIDVDLIVVAGKLKVEVGGGFRTGINFTDAGTVFHTGTTTYVDAHIGLSGSVGVACAGANLNANVSFNQDGEISSSGSWYTEGNATLSLTGNAYCGIGCCDGDCDYLGVPCPSKCFKDSWSGTKSFGFFIHMGSDKNEIKLTF